MRGNTNAAQSITVDNVLSTTSTNPVQNKAITTAVNANTANIATNTSDIASLETAIAGARGVYEVPIAFDMLAPEYHPTLDYEGLKTAVLNKKDILIVDAVAGSNQFSCVGYANYSVAGGNESVRLYFQTAGIVWNMKVASSGYTTFS